MTKTQSLKEDFSKAIERMEKVLREEKTDIVRDAAIKRFEITFELAWKTVKAFLEEIHNTSCVSPRTCFQEAFRVKLVDYSEQLLQLLDDRNYTAHTYKELLAEKVYADLPNALQAFKSLYQALEEQMNNG